MRSIAAGFAYARGRQDLLGSYLADLAAMTLAYPNALFPFVAADLHAPWAVGLMFAAPSAGALAITVVSGWMGRVRRHGLAIAVSAAVWGLLITAFGLAPDLAVALGCLVLAGAADMVSGIFRDTLWNQTIPDRLRGRMAGLELLSYGVGPSAGQVRAGAVASVTSARFSLASGGLFCAGAVGLVCLALPGFTRYRAGPAPRRRAAASNAASAVPLPAAPWPLRRSTGRAAAVPPPATSRARTPGVPHGCQQWHDRAAVPGPVGLGGTPRQRAVLARSGCHRHSRATNQCPRRLPGSPASARDVSCHLAGPRGPQQRHRHRLPARPAVLRGRATVMAGRRVRHRATFLPSRPRRHRAAPGHDAWVMGDEPVVVVDWWGASNYARAETRLSRGRGARASSQRARPGAPGRRPARASSMARWNVG